MVPQNGLFLLWKIVLKWIMTVGTPILGNHHMANDKAEVMAYAKAAF